MVRSLGAAAAATYGCKAALRAAVLQGSGGRRAPWARRRQRKVVAVVNPGYPGVSSSPNVAVVTAPVPGAAPPPSSVPGTRGHWVAVVNSQGKPGCLLLPAVPASGRAPNVYDVPGCYVRGAGPVPLALSPAPASELVTG